MNWKRVATYAVALFVVGVLNGIAEGYAMSAFQSPTAHGVSALALISSVVYFAANVAIFAHMAFRQHDRPFLHAVLAASLSLLAAFLFLYAIVGEFPYSGVVDGLLLSVPDLLAIVAGTQTGIHLRRSLPGNAQHASGAQ